MIFLRFLMYSRYLLSEIKFGRKDNNFNFTFLHNDENSIEKSSFFNVKDPDLGKMLDPDPGDSEIMDLPGSETLIFIVN